MKRTTKILLTLTLCLLGTGTLRAKPSKYRVELPQPPARFFNGLAVGVDGVGFGMKLVSPRFANMEILGRINLMEKYFPIVELGIGECNREGNEQNTVFHTRAPYFRVGADYSFTKKRNGNRLYAGLRYGFSRFDYDYSNPDFQDPVWPTPGRSVGVRMTDIQGKAHWAEFCVGVETKLWKFIRMGWNLRYKARLKQGDLAHGQPWFVPGFGKNDSSTWGGTVNLVFEFQSIRFGKVMTKPELPSIKK